VPLCGDSSFLEPLINSDEAHFFLSASTHQELTLSAAFLGEENAQTAGEAIVWAAALGPACAARAALVTRPLTPSGGVRSAICRIAESSKAILKFDDVAAIKFLTHPISSGCTNRPRLEKGKGKKRAAGVPTASVATAVDLGGEEGGAPPAKRSNSSLLEETVYAMGALAGERSLDWGRGRNVVY